MTDGNEKFLNTRRRMPGGLGALASGPLLCAGRLLRASLDSVDRTLVGTFRIRNSVSERRDRI